MPTCFTPTRLTIALVIVVLAGVGFKQTFFAQHAGAVTRNAGLDISQCRNAEKIPEMKLQNKSFVFPNI
jgi:hypothetical protein